VENFDLARKPLIPNGQLPVHECGKLES